MNKNDKKNVHDIVNNQQNNIKMISDSKVDVVNTNYSTSNDLMSEINIEEEVDSEFLNDFLLETKEHLETIETNIINLESDPGNIDLIHGLFREFHTIKGLAGFVNQNLIRELSHRTETLLDKSRKQKVPIDKNLFDLILLSSDYIKRVCADLGLNQDHRFIASVAGHISALDMASAQEADGVLGGAENAPAGQDQELEQREIPVFQVSGMANVNGGHVRVSNQKVDNLGDLTGEMLIIHSQVEQEITSRFGTNDTLVASLMRMGKIAKNIQALSMSLRMVSLKSTFLKVSRIGRDTAAEMGKNVRLQITGEETEIDRHVAESILDPLLHLIKNSIYHGIESEASRLALGKPAQGCVRVQAYSRRDSVYIDVSDDGQGIPLEQIRVKAEEKKLLDPARTYEDEEILNLIFLPGFTTVKSADAISGRGVGLDVVRTEVYKIGGRVEIKNRPGEGCSFLLKIPINLGAINGTIVDIVGGSYISLLFIFAQSSARNRINGSASPVTNR